MDVVTVPGSVIVKSTLPYYPPFPPDNAQHRGEYRQVFDDRAARLVEVAGVQAALLAAGGSLLVFAARRWGIACSCSTVQGRSDEVVATACQPSGWPTSLNRRERFQ
jgi:hypothetical protein